MKRGLALAALAVLTLSAKDSELFRRYNEPPDAVFETILQLARAKSYIVVASCPHEHIFVLRTPADFSSPGIEFIGVAESDREGNTTISLQVFNQPILVKKGNSAARKLLDELDAAIAPSSAPARK